MKKKLKQIIKSNLLTVTETRESLRYAESLLMDSPAADSFLRQLSKLYAGVKMNAANSIYAVAMIESEKDLATESRMALHGYIEKVVESSADYNSITSEMSKNFAANIEQTISNLSRANKKKAAPETEEENSIDLN